MRARSLIVVVGALGSVVLAACGSGGRTVDVQSTTPATEAPSSPTTSVSPAGQPSTTATPTDPTTTVPARSIAWSDCGDGLECGRLTVPLDYDDPAGDTIDLSVLRRPADDPDRRIGSLLVNPGGPGLPGTEMAAVADGYLSSALLERFDIIGWDPRGAGDSSPVDCVDDLDPYFALDPTPDDDAERQALITAGQEFAKVCEERSGRILPHISTQDSARDMEEIRRALGEERISYFGFSYGSELGATFATLFPGSVRAMVVDGAVDPNSDVVDEGRRQVAGLERSLNAFLADCAARSSCPFHNGGDPGAAFDAVMARLDGSPLRVRGRDVTQGIAYIAVVSALYSRGDWEVLAEALADAQDGDGRLLQALYDNYVHRAPDGTFDNLFESLIAINCLDDPGPTDLAFPERFAEELARDYPRLGRASGPTYFCNFWPARSPAPLRVTGAGAGPIVVVGTTGDPITPIESTRRLAEELEEGVLVTVEADEHTGYGTNRCIVRAVDRYLLDLTVPEAGLVCR